MILAHISAINYVQCLYTHDVVVVTVVMVTAVMLTTAMLSVMAFNAYIGL